MNYNTLDTIKELYAAKKFDAALTLLDSALTLNASRVTNSPAIASRTAQRVEVLNFIRPQIVAEQARFAAPVSMAIAPASSPDREPAWITRAIERAEVAHYEG